MTCDDDGHAGNSVIMLPGNQEVISQWCRSSCPLSLQTGWDFHFRYFTSHLDNILCELQKACLLAYLTVRQRRKSEEKMEQELFQREERETGNAGRDEEKRGEDIYSRLSSAQLTALSLRCAFYFHQTFILASSFC